MENTQKTSANGIYGNMIQKMIETGKKFKDKNAEPKVIVNLILKAINSKKPKTRYSGGFMAKP